MHGKSFLPKEYQNELIIGKVEEKLFSIFNNKLLIFNKNSYKIKKVSKKNMDSY
jgi:hypothetical protein